MKALSRWSSRTLPPPSSSFPSEGFWLGWAVSLLRAGTELQRVWEARHSLGILSAFCDPTVPRPLSFSVVQSHWQWGWWEDKGFQLCEHVEIKGTCVPLAGHPTLTLGEHSIPEGAHHYFLSQQPWPAGRRRAWLFPPSGAGSLLRWKGNTSSTCPKAPPPGPARFWSSSRLQKVLAWQGHTLVWRLHFSFAASCRVGHSPQALAEKQPLTGSRGPWTNGTAMVAKGGSSQHLLCPSSRR